MIKLKLSTLLASTMLLIGGQALPTATHALDGIQFVPPYGRSDYSPGYQQAHFRGHGGYKKGHRYYKRRHFGHRHYRRHAPGHRYYRHNPRYYYPNYGNRAFIYYYPNGHYSLGFSFRFGH